MPMRMSIMRPIPFCPSFEPCAKLTPVQVRTSNDRIQNGGGVSPFGGWYKSGLRTEIFASNRSNGAAQKPMIGETRSEAPTSSALLQLTPSPTLVPLVSREFANPTPRIEPIRVCELEAGSPKYRSQDSKSSRRVEARRPLRSPLPFP